MSRTVAPEGEPTRQPDRRSGLLLAALALLFAAGCTPGGSDARLASTGERYFGDITPPRGQVFTYNNGPEPQSTDPALMSGAPDGRVARTLFEGLTVPHPETLEPLPGIAYRWELSEDGLTYTFHLRESVWNDGTPLTARDFEWSCCACWRPRPARNTRACSTP